MSFFKNRVGGSFYRSRAIKGYFRILFNKEDQEDVEKVNNTMSAKYAIKEE